MCAQLQQWILNNVVGQNSAWFWTMAQGIAVTLTLIFIYRQLVAQRFTNILSSVASLDGRWNSDEMRKARKVLCAKYNSANRTTSQHDGLVLDFFEQMGLYLQKGVFTPDIIWELYSYYIEHYWCIAKPLVDEFRLTTDDKSWYSSFYYLYEAMQKEGKKRGITCDGKTQEQIAQFIKGENEKL
jgi:hypothetical protein